MHAVNIEVVSDQIGWSELRKILNKLNGCFYRFPAHFVSSGHRLQGLNPLHGNRTSTRALHCGRSDVSFQSLDAHGHRRNNLSLSLLTRVICDIRSRKRTEKCRPIPADRIFVMKLLLKIDIIFFILLRAHVAADHILRSFDYVDNLNAIFLIGQTIVFHLVRTLAK